MVEKVCFHHQYAYYLQMNYCYYMSNSKQAVPLFKKLSVHFKLIVVTRINLMEYYMHI